MVKKATEVKNLNKKMKNNELDETKALLLRVQADFENYRKRTQKEKEEFGQYLNMDLILRIIPTLDNFKLALRHLPKELQENDWVKGIWHIERQLEQTLEDEGVTEIQSVGSQFDPIMHEAIEEVTAKSPPGTITEEIIKGYKLKDKIIRHAKVKVSSGNTK